jgi:hypothetical protein
LAQQFGDLPFAGVSSSAAGLGAKGWLATASCISPCNGSRR